MSDSIYKSDVEERLLSVLEQPLLSLGVRIIDMDLRIGPRSLLRLYIEKNEADARGARAVSIDNCATVSRALDPLLEAESVFPRSYDLEVSSAGLDRRLRLRTDFENVIGSEVKLALVEKLNGVAANVRGKVLRLEGEGLVLGYNGEEVPVRLKQIAQATLVWNEKNQKSA